jgi:hypothetical protein
MSQIINFPGNRQDNERFKRFYKNLLRLDFQEKSCYES